MSIEQLNMGEGDSVKFLEGHELRTALMLLPVYAKKSVYIMVPFIGRGQLLNSILNIPNHIKIKMFTRDKKGYLPSIKTLADPTLDELKLKKNIQVFIDNKIHAKIWLIEEMVIVHSMNGTFHSENHNFEAGIMTTDKRIINEIYDYFVRAENEAVRLQEKFC
ncbi:MAG: phospholipase D-like domain-containing protein [Candidatus Hodarchaeales archaeon]|jgi:phosphatidylserine/phosphatidylglycerophosphate/cardiolipin synthase-like enzyme